MASNNVEFFARMQRLQKQQHESEQQRMELEHQFNTYLSSDKRLSRLKAAKLQRLWQKVCEDEKRSKARNQQLLTDYHRVEAHVAALSTRTERLKQLKDQYERQVELIYPRWKEQLEAKRLQQQMAQQQKQRQAAMQGHHQLPGGIMSQQGVMPGQQTLPSGIMSQHTPLQGHHQQFPDGVLYNSQHPATSTYPSTVNGQASGFGQSHQLAQSIPQQHGQISMPQQHGQLSMPQQHGQSYPAHQQTQVPLGSQLQGQVYPSTPFNAHSPMPNGQQAAQYEGYMQGPGSHMSQGQPMQSSQQMNVNQDQRIPIEEQRLHPHQGLTADTINNPPSSLYDTVPSRSNDPRVDHTESMQDPNTRLESGSIKPAVQHDNYTHQKVQHQSNGSGDQAAIQREQQMQRANQEQPQESVRPNQHNRPKADSVGETSSSISVSSDSQYSGSDLIRPQITISNSQQSTKPDSQPTDSIVHNNNTIGQKQGDYSEDHPASDQRESKDSLTTQDQRPASRADSRLQVNSGVLPVSSRTDRTEPFSSEGEEDDEEEEEDEDSAAVRGAIREQLNIDNNPVVRVEVTKHTSPDKQESPPIQSASARTATEDEEDEEESDSEIGSDMSLPLSDTQNDPGKQGGGDTWTTGQHTASSKASSKETTNEPSITEKGFWLLTHTVEMEIDHSDDVSGIYNSPNCTGVIRNEIIKSANQNSGLSRLDPNAVSMVIIQVLPSMVSSFQGGCLMSDKMLSANRPINEISVRSFIYSAALAFWDKLIKHLERLVKKGVFEPDEVATLIAPLLIHPESEMVDKAVNVLQKILEEVVGEEDSFFDESLSMTLPTPTPQKKPETKSDENQQQHLKVPPLNLGDTDRSDRSEDIETDRSNDSFFDNKVPLTETDAYQRLLGNTFGTDKPEDVKEESVDDESDSEDEIEKAARITPQTPTSENKKKRNVLSSLGGSLGLSYGSDEDDDDDRLKVTGGSTQRSDAVSSPGQSDMLSSPSPPGTGGYVPSAMEHSMKSTGRSDPMQRSAAFWGAESDMDDESEMTVPMGTGTATVKSEEDKDDFDFYD